MTNNTGFRVIFKREFRRILTSKVYIWGVICASIISLFTLTYLMHQGLPEKMPISVVDLDDTATTRGLINMLDASQMVDVKYKDTSFTNATNRMEHLEVYGIVLIPEGFTTDINTGVIPKMSYYTNNSFLVAGSLLGSNLATFGSVVAGGVNQSKLTAKGIGPIQVSTIVNPSSAQIHPIGNPYISYSILLNAILAGLVMQLVVLMFTMSGFGSEIKLGTGKELVRLANNNAWSLMFGKLLPNTIIFSLLGLFNISILYYYNGFPLKSGFLAIFVAYILLVMATQAFAVTLFSLFRNYRLAVSVGSLLGMLSFSLVGMSYPTTSMNPSLEAIAHIFPIKYFFYIIGDQALNGYPLRVSLIYYIILMCFILLGLTMFFRMKKILQYDIYED